MSIPLHHVALCPANLESSLRFYCEGVGLAVLMDHIFEGDWNTLLGAPGDELRAVFLGDPVHADSGIVELVTFPEGVEAAAVRAPTAPAAGVLLLSFYVDLEPAVARLAAIGHAVQGRITVHGVGMATVRDPDGVLVELIDGATAAPTSAMGAPPP